MIAPILDAPDSHKNDAPRELCFSKSTQFFSLDSLSTRNRKPSPHARNLREETRMLQCVQRFPVGVAAYRVPSFFYCHR